MSNGVSTPAERRVITALFADVVGSTALAEAMDPEDWTDVVNRTVAVMSESIERYSGTIAQFAGDSILALFGAPTAHEDDPYRAVRAGLDILDAVKRLAVEVQREVGIDIQVRAGINTGLVVTGDLSAGDLNVYAALGDTTNVAARMQSLAEPGSLVISDATYRLVSSDVDVDALGPTEVKGKAEPMLVYLVNAVRGVDTRTRGIPGLESPMVGRDPELETLLSLVDIAQAGRGRMAAVIGEPGVGKSRLIRELGAQVRRLDGARWVLGRCASYDEHRPYHLIASIVRALAGVTDSDDLETVGAAVSHVSVSVFGNEDPRIGHLLQLLGVNQGHDDDNPDVLHGFYVTALSDLLEGLAGQHHPLVLVCEDIHWADASSSELLAETLQRLQMSTVLVVMLTRPDRESHGWDVLAGARRHFAEAFTEIELRPLEDSDSRRLVANLLEIESLPEDLRRIVLDKAEGNPFFLEEVIRMLIERDLVELQDGRWVARTEIADLDVPATVHGLLASRVDMLPPEARQAGKVASVIGRQFEARLLDVILPPGGNGAPPVHPQLHALEAHGFVRLAETRPQLEFTFRHALIHDVMYGSLLKRERRQLHRDVAKAIEATYPDRVDELAPVLARHYTEAGLAEEAVPYLFTAGRQSLARHAKREAYEFFVSACSLLDAMQEAPPELRIEAVLGRVRAGGTFIPTPETLASLDSVSDLAQQLGDPDLIGRLSVEQIRIWEMMGQNYRSAEYREALDRAFGLIPDIRDPGLRAVIKGLMGRARRSADDFTVAVDVLAASVGELADVNRLVDAALNAALVADAQATLGRFGETETWLDRAMELAIASGDPNTIADADLFRGKVASERGDLAEALEHTKRGIAAAEEAGNFYCTLVGNFFVADQQLRLGNAEEAIPYLERSSELAEFCDAGAFVAFGAAWLAAARAQLGDLEPADFDAPLAQAQASQSRLGEGMVRMHRAIALSGDDATRLAALDEFERAAALFAEIGARPNEARTLHAYGLALDVTGDHDQAARRLREAEAIFEELGIEPDPTPAA